VWPVEIYLSAHLSSWPFLADSAELCLQRRDMKDATEVGRHRVSWGVGAMGGGGSGPGKSPAPRR